MKVPTAAAISAARGFENNAKALELLAFEEEAATIVHDNPHELLLRVFARRLTALEYRRKALLLRGVSSDDLDACIPSEARERTP